MARAQGPDRGAGGGGLRIAVLFVGLCLAGAATVAVLVTRDPQLLRLAVVGALWAFLLAALAVPRRRPPATPVADLSPGREVELRRAYEIELEREVAARREYELQLEVYLRRELEQSMRQDVEALREEVQRLRSEVLDRLDGELRMERIETTRLIGGSLRALQDEARRLGISRGLIAEDTGLSFDGSAAFPGGGEARAELPAGAEGQPGTSLYESLQGPGGAGVGSETGTGGGEFFGAPPAPRGYEPFAADHGQYEPPPPGAPPSPAPTYGGYERDPAPPPADQPSPPERAGYAPAAGYGGHDPPPAPAREPWLADRAGEPPPPSHGGGYEPPPPPHGGGYEPPPPPHGGGYEPVPPPRWGESGAGAVEPTGSEAGAPAPRRYERSPSHRAPDAARGVGSAGSRGRRDRSAAPAGDLPAHSTDDELSRIFAGTLGSQAQRVAPEPGTGQRRRRYRDDDEQDDVLSRLLGRP